MIKNDKDELIPTGIPIQVVGMHWLKKLDSNIRKDYFLLPFLDQMLEMLVGRAFYISFIVSPAILSVHLSIRLKKDVHLVLMPVERCPLVYAMPRQPLKKVWYSYFLIWLSNVLKFSSMIYLFMKSLLMIAGLIWESFWKDIETTIWLLIEKNVISW